MNDYQKKYQETRKTELELWKDMANKIVGSDEEEQVTFTYSTKIIEILNETGKNKASNHTFLPSGGGLDIIGASASHERDLIEINMDGATHIVNPKSLTFNRVEDNPEWWYYRLNCLPFSSSGVYEEEEDEDNEDSEKPYKSKRDKDIEELMKFHGEELLEVAPGDYRHRSYWDENHLGYDEYGRTIPLPHDARLVIRMNNGGDLVIFSKYSLYNQVSSTYDGRHNKMSEHEFFNHIVRAEKSVRDAETK